MRKDTWLDMKSGLENMSKKCLLTQFEIIEIFQSFLILKILENVFMHDSDHSDFIQIFS